MGSIIFNAKRYQCLLLIYHLHFILHAGFIFKIFTRYQRGDGDHHFVWNKERKAQFMGGVVTAFFLVTV
jgi:hypothetical protein